MRKLKENTTQLFFILAIILMFPGTSVLSQSLKVVYEEIQPANGVSLGKINAVTQDNLGFMWLSDSQTEP